MHPSLELKLEQVEHLYFNEHLSLAEAVEKAERMDAIVETVSTEKAGCGVFSDAFISQAELVAQVCLRYALPLSQGIREVTSLVDYLQKKNLTENEAIGYAAYCFGLARKSGVPAWKFHFESRGEYLDELARKAEFENDSARKDARARANGYASHTAYTVEMQKKRRARKREM